MGSGPVGSISAHGSSSILGEARQGILPDSSIPITLRYNVENGDLKNCDQSAICPVHAGVSLGMKTGTSAAEWVNGHSKNQNARTIVRAFLESLHAYK
jgi:hypothetical protein